MTEIVQYLANPDVSVRVEDPEDGAILFNPDTNAVLVINPVGLITWEALEKPLTLAELEAVLRERCEEVPEDCLSEDVQRFLDSLRVGGFIGEAA